MEQIKQAKGNVIKHIHSADKSASGKNRELAISTLNYSVYINSSYSKDTFKVLANLGLRIIENAKAIEKREAKEL